jgi:hypothetical protein
MQRTKHGSNGASPLISVFGRQERSGEDVKRFVGWLFSRHDPSPTPWKVIVWWEIRRIPFNIIIGLYGFVCLIIFLMAIGTSGRLQAGEDAVEPIGLLFAPFAINALYTLGWLVEIPARLLTPGLSARLGPVLLGVGIGAGFILISIPAVFWVGVRMLQLAGIVR